MRERERKVRRGETVPEKGRGRKVRDVGGKGMLVGINGSLKIGREEERRGDR